MKKVETLIIGAGPAGLAVAGRCRKAGIAFEIIEASDKVGVAWHNHYDRLHLHTVKQWSHLPHMPFPENYPLYVSRQQLVDYFEDYASKFEIKPLFGHEAKKIEKKADKWEIITSKETFEADHVIIATGVNRVTVNPTWPGQEDFGGEIVHSRFYKNAQPYIGKKVLVVGLGNTGAELALDLSEHDIETFVSVRSPISVVPRDLNGRPVQVTSKQLAKLPFGLGDWLGSQIRKLYFGNIEKYGLKEAKMAPAQQLRETGKTPIVDIGTIAAIKKGKIKVKPDIDHFAPDEVIFSDRSREKIDAIILATGYKAQIEDFFPQVAQFRDRYGLPKGTIGEGPINGVYFVGYDNYKLGGIIGTINTDSETIVNHLITLSKLS